MTPSSDARLRFHWRLPLGGEGTTLTRAEVASRSEPSLPDLDAQAQFCRAAEEIGIDSLLTNFGWQTADPIVLATALALRTQRIKFIIAYRAGLMSAPTFVQQLNTLSGLARDRFSINIVAGTSPEEQRSYGDFLPHDERYARAAEFLAICRALWRREGPVEYEGRYYRVEKGRIFTPYVSQSRTFPEILVSGSSRAAEQVAMEQGTCWMRLADAPDVLGPQIRPALDRGIEVGVRLSMVVRPTRAEAIRAAQALATAGADREGAREREREFVRTSDSVSIKETYARADVEWLTPYLWTGAVRVLGATSLALVGSPADVAEGILAFAEVGVSQFIFSGWPKLEEMQIFGREVLPLVRERERERGS